MLISDVAVEHSYTVYAAIVISVATVAIRLAKGLFDFYDDYVLKRFLKRVDDLSTKCSVDSTQSQFIDALKCAEIFRLLSGIKASPKKAESLMMLYLSGVLSIESIKMISPYIEPCPLNVINVVVSRHQKFMAYYSRIVSAFIFITGLIVASPFLFTGGLGYSLVGTAVVVLFAFFSRVMVKDFRAYKCAIDIKNKLDDKTLMLSYNISGEIISD